MPDGINNTTNSKVSYETKLATGLTLAVILPLLVFAIISLHSVTDAMINTIANDLQKKSILVANHINDFISERLIDARVLSQADVLESKEISKTIQYLTETVKENQWINDVDVLDKSGIVIASSGIQNEKNQRIGELYPGSKDLFSKTLHAKQGQVFVSEALKLDTGYGLLIMTPVTDDTNMIVIGVIAIEVNLNNISGTVRLLNEGVVGNKYVYIVDNYGKVIITDDPDVNIFDLFPDLLVQPQLLSAFSNQGDTGYLTYIDSHDDSVMAGYADMAEFGVNKALDWSIIAVVPLEEITADATKLKWLLTGAGIIIGLIAMILAFAYVARFKKELNSLGNHAKLISQGDYSKRLPEVSGNKDGFGKLIYIFNCMTSKMESTMNTLHHQEKVLKNSNQRLEEMVERRTTDLNKSMQQAKAASRAKSVFLANISHEIRTPMNAIIGMSHLALQTELNDKQKNYISKAHHSAEYLLCILNDILDLTKIEAGKLKFEEVGFHLKDVIGNMLNLIKLKAEEKGIQLSVKINHDVPNYLIGDSLRLSQVLTNLEGNAVKFCNTGDLVSLKITLQEESEHEAVLQFSIQDTGIGISPEQQEKLFQAFSQADSSTTREYGGTGLGLVISKNIVQMMGGVIWVESEQNVGSTFHFTVRLKKQQASSLQTKILDTGNESDTEKAIATLRDAKILLVEDNDLNQEFMQELFLMEDITIETAWNGKEALELLANQHFDIVLMDCQMPVMDGYKATQKIREQESLKDLPVIAMTGNAMKGHLEKVLAIGMNDQISKPIKSASMFVTMAKWISQKNG